MRKKLVTLAALGAGFLLCAAALGAPAKIRLTLTDERGRPVQGAVVMFSPADDPTTKLPVGENEAGIYEDSVDLAQDQATWTLTKVVADGYLPIRVTIVSAGPDGTGLQEVREMELNPGIPVPPIQLASGGSVRIDITLGDQSEVMARFVEARKAARARAEQEAADLAAAAAEQEAYATALRLYNEGDLDGALPHFQEALRRNPEDLELHLTYARILYKAKRFEAFEAASQPALGLDPGNTELRMMLYSGRRERGDLSGALREILELKKLGTRGADLMPHLNFLAQSMGRKKEAVPAWQAILDIDRSNREACVALAFIHAAMGERRLSDQYLQRAVDLAPEQAPGLYYDMASRLVTRENATPGDLDRGIELLHQAIGLDPSFAPAYKRLGLALWKKQDYAGTREAFVKYLELNPNADDKKQIEDYLSQLTE